MSYFILTAAVLNIVSQTIQGDYWHATTWLIAGLGAFVNILDDATIRDLKRENASLRASRDSWAANARAEAWEAGFESGMCYTRELDNGNHDLELATNPYRSEDR